VTDQPFEGVIVQTGGGVYHVMRGSDIPPVEASLRGRLKLQAREGDRVVIGDRARVEPVAGGWTIEEVLPRRNVILRRDPHAPRPKAITANVDRVIVVAAASHPPLDVHRIDRFLVIAAAAGVPASIVINKCDLSGASPRLTEVEGLYRPLGYTVLGTSAESGVGLDELRGILSEGVSVLLGASGTGKTSLLNALDPALDLRIGELSRKLSRGRHTTVNARLIGLTGGGQVADTPGFEHAGPWGISSANLDTCFPEMEKLSSECRFRGCSHTHEPGCAIRMAGDAGTIAETRLESYRRIREELQETRGG